MWKQTQPALSGWDPDSMVSISIRVKSKLPGRRSGQSTCFRVRLLGSIPAHR